jgi:uncharacterized protein HemX
LEDVDKQDPHEKQQGDRTEQQMADIVLAIVIAMGEGVPGYHGGNQQKDPIDQLSAFIDSSQKPTARENSSFSS